MNEQETLNLIRLGVLEGIILVDRAEHTPFIPQERLVLEGNPARKLNSRDRARLLKIVNQTRSGKAHFEIEIDYNKQTDAAPRIKGKDYQAPSVVSTMTHFGLVTSAKHCKNGGYIINVLDVLRQNKGQPSFTSIRLEGIKRLKIVSENKGPVPPKPGCVR